MSMVEVLYRGKRVAAHVDRIHGINFRECTPQMDGIADDTNAGAATLYQSHHTNGPVTFIDVVPQIAIRSHYCHMKPTSRNSTRQNVNEPMPP